MKVYEYTFGTGFQAWTLVVGECLAVHVDSEIFDGKELRHERMLSIVNGGGETYGVCTDFCQENLNNVQLVIVPIGISQR